MIKGYRKHMLTKWGNLLTPTFPFSIVWLVAFSILYSGICSVFVNSENVEHMTRAIIDSNENVSNQCKHLGCFNEFNDLIEWIYGTYQIEMLIHCNVEMDFFFFIVECIK